MLKKNFHLSLKFLVFLALTCLVFTAAYFFKISTSNSQPSPNLILISIDTMRPDHTTIYGYQKDTTPNMNKFAQNANVFTNLRTIIPMTYPSFASLMTGKDFLNTRIIRNRGTLLSGNTKTLASILRENGYETAAFTTGAISPEQTNLDQGFEAQDYLTFKSYFYKDKIEHYYQSSRSEYESYISQAKTWLDENKDKKIFFWLHLMDPHAPYQPPDDLKCRFNSQYCNYIQSKTNKELEEERSKNQLCQTTSVSAQTAGVMETLYDGGIAYSDRLVGDVLSYIKSLNLDKNSIIVIYSDHGEGFDHDYYFNHRDVLYESAIKIPLIIKLPAQSKPKLIDTQLQNLDITPTILDLLNIKYDHRQFDGLSVASTLNKNFFSQFQPPLRKYQFFANYSLTKYAIFDGRFKYIYSLPSSCLFNNQAEELYDLKSDPQELRNLFQDKVDLKDKLKQELLNHLAAYNLPPGTSRASRNLLPLPVPETESSQSASPSANTPNADYLRLPY